MGVLLMFWKMNGRHKIKVHATCIEQGSYPEAGKQYELTRARKVNAQGILQNIRPSWSFTTVTSQQIVSFVQKYLTNPPPKKQQEQQHCIHVLRKLRLCNTAFRQYKGD